ncbi:ATP-binding cassette domain-containing protein [Fulvivirga lutimaris]|uniref:ATP-binding cassette domain-containing protein n=1 Tax=Fulvivirga lutimaris TaxID=1819566 RepID=UPI0012BBBE94|nr:ATP-binding cassette domain-containing protein [Fulvivirga lutimaris]MTI38731.1 ATP-binding cassette domain-containing protein [Fulvivirga lutimaris]
MSEEILKALTQLFAIITKQDGGVTEKERQFVISFFQQELDQDSVKEYLELYDKFVGYNQDGGEEKKEDDDGGKKRKLTSVRDSVKTLGLCKKINKTLTQKQKVVVLIKILELVGSDKNFTPQRMEIIDTISTVFNIVKDEYKLIESFVIKADHKELNFNDILIVNNEGEHSHDVEAIKAEAENSDTHSKHFNTDIDGNIIFLKVNSVDMYFTKYIGKDQIVLNGFIMQRNRVYLFSHGSTVKTPLGAALYYSDLIALFNEELQTAKLSFNANITEFRFPNGALGLRDVQISEGPGQLIGIMGASGAGKTTLMNVLAGIEQPTVGSVKINGFDINTEKEKIHGVIGYVSQDDLLIEELTVYENLYYNAKLCFANLSEEDLSARVLSVLESLGLDQRKDLKVGSVLDKTISGGQRKRLNIALELIREPAVMFVDEPTSGLSSRDSENVIDLLKELSLKGKLIFVVIHQPSSDIYKMFSKMYIMDTGGYPVFYGNPVEAVTYFKKATNQVDSQRGQCETCGNVNPEQIFNIIEAKVVDEYGQLTNKRKVNPQQWNDSFIEHFTIEKVEDLNEEPAHSLFIPNKIKQSIIFTTRDLLSKISNRQYLLINLLEAPLLAVILAFIIKYKSSPFGDSYIFRFNDNIPAFMLMSIIVALFMGLTVSAEEIIRDRKILKRESFLNLSWNSYLMSKLFILFLLSAIQTMMFVVVGHLILEIHGMTFAFWFALFTCSCMANVLGLNISSAFNSAVTVYVMIPLLLIPQMILSGLLFSFDKLNDILSTKGKVPIVADMMASRWTYEAMAVYQFKNNTYAAPYFDIEKTEAKADFKAAYLVEELKRKNQFIGENLEGAGDSLNYILQKDLRIIRNNLEIEPFREGIEELDIDNLTLENYNKEINQQLVDYFTAYKRHYQDVYNKSVATKEKMVYFFENNAEYEYNLNQAKNEYYNESLADLVMNVAEKDRIIEYDGELIQQINPIYNDPTNPSHFLDYRTHFFAPQKYFMGTYFSTYTFNLIVVWIMTLILYIFLYFEALRKGINAFGKIKIGSKKSK